MIGQAECGPVRRARHGPFGIKTAWQAVEGPPAILRKCSCSLCHAEPPARPVRDRAKGIRFSCGLPPCRSGVPAPFRTVGQSDNQASWRRLIPARLCLDRLRALQRAFAMPTHQASLSLALPDAQLLSRLTGKKAAVDSLSEVERRRAASAPHPFPGSSTGRACDC